MSDDPSIDSIRLKRFQKMVSDMKSDSPKKSIEFDKMDYSNVFSFVEDQKLNGSLVGDPAWGDVNYKRKSTLSRWQDRLKMSLNHLNKTFSECEIGES